jgi:hypothetical protein
MRYSIQISFIAAIFILVACHRPPEYADTPRIAFERLQLTDTSSLVLTFSFRDGDGDIGLDGDRVEDLSDPFHSIGFVTDANGVIVTLDGNHPLPWDLQPAAFLSVNSFFPLEDTTSAEPFEVAQNSIIIPVPAGNPVPFAEQDVREPYVCDDYEIFTFYLEQEFLVEFQGLIGTAPVVVDQQTDTVLVQRNPFHFNIYIDLLIKEGEDFVPFDGFPDCDPGFTARFPVFERSGFDRPIDGEITYAFFSTQFATENSFLLEETLKIRFFIYDRALNQSNVVETPEFQLLDLRQQDLTAP